MPRGMTPPVEIYIARLIRKCEQGDPYLGLLTECRRLIAFLDDINAKQKCALADALEANLSRSARGVANVARALRGPRVRRLNAPRAWLGTVR